MRQEDELTIELAKNKADEYIAKKELEDAKSRFIRNIDDILGNEIKDIDFHEINKPVKYKKPFKLKVKDFFNKLGRVFG